MCHPMDIFCYYPHYTLNMYNVAAEPSEIPRFGPKTMKNLTLQIILCAKMGITSFFAHKLKNLSSLRVIPFSEQTINLFASMEVKLSG